MKTVKLFQGQCGSRANKVAFVKWLFDSVLSLGYCLNGFLHGFSVSWPCKKDFCKRTEVTFFCFKRSIGPGCTANLTRLKWFIKMNERKHTNTAPSVKVGQWVTVLPPGSKSSALRRCIRLNVFSRSMQDSFEYLGLHLHHLADSLIQSNLHTIYLINTTEQLSWEELGALLKGPFCGSLAGLGFKLMNFWSTVQLFNHWATSGDFISLPRYAHLNLSNGFLPILCPEFRSLALDPLQPWPG